jgi:hypothetical protein
VSYQVVWDRDRFRIKDTTGNEPDKDLPIDTVLTWLNSGGLALASHTHASAYVAKTSRGSMTATSEITDAAAKAAIDAISAALVTAGLMTVYVAPSSSSSG